MQFTQGQRVKTPLGCGSVCHQRMAPPNYTEVEAVKVLLDARLPSAFADMCRGTILLAREVEPDEDPVTTCRCCGFSAPWSRWTLNGLQDDANDPEGEVLELRSCLTPKCENTQARQMPRR